MLINLILNLMIFFLLVKIFGGLSGMLLFLLVIDNLLGCIVFIDVIVFLFVIFFLFEGVVCLGWFCNLILILEFFFCLICGLGIGLLFFEILFLCDFFFMGM